MLRLLPLPLLLLLRRLGQLQPQAGGVVGILLRLTLLLTLTLPLQPVQNSVNQRKTVLQSAAKGTVRDCGCKAG
jgi:hypothetical protein